MSRSIIYIRFLLLSLLIVSVQTVTAQDTSKAVFIAKLRALQQQYAGVSALHYDISYRYSNEHSPATILDSLEGSVNIQDGFFRYQLDSTVTIKTDKYNIILFEKDKLMYLSKPGQQATGYDPIAMFDSTVSRIPNLSYLTEETNQEVHLLIQFPEGLQYKKMELTIDKASGFLSKVNYVIRTEQLLEQGATGERDAEYEPYANVEARFLNYEQAKADSSLFDDTRYFSRSGNDFKTTEAYKDYKIFLGSPNL